MPLLVVMITLGLFLAQADISRQETAVYTRSSAMAAATVGYATPFTCAVDSSATGGRPEVTQSTSADCSTFDGERGLSTERPFWREMTAQARDWRDILRDVKPSGPIRDIHASGSGSVRFDRSVNFFQSQGDPANTTEFAITREDFWSDANNPWKAGHDAVVWEELRKRGTWNLFPRVFPSK
jgi:hypothetical protein